MNAKKTIKLTELLTKEQLDEVERILLEHTEDRFEASNHLKRYLAGFRKELEAKGADPGYLAYCIAYRQWTGGDNGDRSVAFST